MDMPKKPKRELIDKLMLLEKSLAGAPSWSITSRTGEQRCKFPVSLNGQITPLEFVVDVHPRERNQSFTFTLNYLSCIMRLDHDGSGHRNGRVKGITTPNGIEMGMIDGPHLHSWADNRILGSDNFLPDELKFARPIPSQVRGYENSFRYFCGVANLSFLETQLPPYPTTDVML
jgi:hypothetical protein